jgi:hypothetical protein
LSISIRRDLKRELIPQSTEALRWTIAAEERKARKAIPAELEKDLRQSLRENIRDEVKAAFAIEWKTQFVRMPNSS